MSFTSNGRVKFPENVRMKKTRRLNVRWANESWWSFSFCRCVACTCFSVFWEPLFLSACLKFYCHYFSIVKKWKACCVFKNEHQKEKYSKWSPRRCFSMVFVNQSVWHISQGINKYSALYCTSGFGQQNKIIRRQIILSIPVYIFSNSLQREEKYGICSWGLGDFGQR